MPEPSMVSTSIIVLAAGNSSRMGVPKQLLEFHGQPLLLHAVETARAAGAKHVVAVLGAASDKLLPVVKGLDVETVINERWAEGMGTSIQTGLAAVLARDVTGAILMLADQPFVIPESLRRLVQAHQETGKPIIASRYSKTVGVPVFFARKEFASLLSLQPNQGCKGVIVAAQEDAHLVDCPEAAIDIDTQEDYARVRGLTFPYRPV